jgi:hypothetical protein
MARDVFFFKRLNKSQNQTLGSKFSILVGMKLHSVVTLIHADVLFQGVASVAIGALAMHPEPAELHAKTKNPMFNIQSTDRVR